MDKKNFDKKSVDKKHPKHKDANPDPITGAPGSHPVGTGVGSAGAAAAGAAIGALGGPVGAAVGGVVGAVAGGVGGHVVGEKINPTAEDAFWRENFTKRPYVKFDEAYEVYRPAFEYGWTTRGRYMGKRFDDVELDLRSEWEKRGFQSQMDWQRAKLAARDAWERIDRPNEFGRV